MPNAQGPGLCSTSVDKKDDHVCSMLVHVVCCNLIRVFFFHTLTTTELSPDLGKFAEIRNDVNVKTIPIGYRQGCRTFQTASHIHVIQM
jgi:hypothetical protein